MSVEIKVPGVGESIQEGMIESWKKHNGDWVDRDEVSLELKTDKATVEVVAEASGKLEILVDAGVVVNVGDVMSKLSTDQQPASSSDANGSASTVQGSGQASTKTSSEKAYTSSQSESTVEHGPAVRRMAAEQGPTCQACKASCRGGRVTKSDLVAQAEVDSPQGKVEQKEEKNPAT